MKKQITPLIYLITIILLSQIIIAIQPTQQFNQIYLNPFYRESMNNNNNYTYTLQVNPPDGISEVKNAIIKFDIYLTPTVTFYLWVNGQTCNNPSYQVHTTYMDSGIGSVAFDCSNRINKAGNYTIKLQPSGANTGASNGWLDLTYMNKPIGTAEVMGTEYQIGDQATIFLQLKDSQGLPVNNGSCYLDVYYPSSYNTSHPEMLNNAPMIFKEEGLYYYDLIAPNYTGVYMTTATCNYALNQIWFYPSGEVSFFPNQTIQTGTWTGTTLVLNDLYDYQWQKATLTAGNPIIANYTWNVSAYGNLSNITNLNVFFTGQSSTAGTLTIAYWNGTALVNLPNVLTYTATGSSTPITFSDQLLTNSIPLSAIENDSVKLRLTSTGSGAYYVFYNWLSLAVLTATGTVQELKGSSEMHISNIAGGIIGNITGNITAQLDNILLTIMTDYNLTREQISALNTTIISLQTNMANNFTNIRNILSTINGQNNLTQAMITNTNLTIHQSITDTQNLINALNTTLLSQFNITNTALQNNITQLQANITSQINALTSHIDGQYNNLMVILNLIYAQVNLTDSRLINFSLATNQTLQQILLAISTDYNLTAQQMTAIQNYLSSMNSNITTNFGNIQSQLTSMGTIQNLTLADLLAINQTINQNILNTQSLITNVNQTMITQFGITNTKIDNLQLNLSSQLNNLEINLTSQMNDIKSTLQQIYIQINLTDSRLINFTISTNQTLQEILTAISTDYNLTALELSQIQNYLISMNNNISINCQDIQNQLTTISTQQNLTIAQLQAINITINQNIIDTQTMITSINQTMLYQFNITNTKIDNLQLNLSSQLNNLEINLSSQLNQIIGYLIYINQTTIETRNLAQQIWDYITSWLNGTINQIEYKLDLLLNASNITLTPITLTATHNAPCITGSDWIIEATVKGNYGQILTNNTVWCNITTDIWNTSSMTYNNGGYFEYRNTCPTPANWTYNITCEEI